MKPIKALILGFLLLVPILVFIFINVFGTHHFSLQTYYPKLDDAGAVVYSATGDTVFEQVPSLKLRSLAGESITQAALEDQVYVAHFFSGSCTDACLKIFSQLVRVQEAFENNQQIRLVSIGAEASPDNLQRLQQLANEFGVRPDRWLLLTGDTSDVLALAAGYHEPFEQHQGILTPSPRLVLVDKEKRIRGIYTGTDPEEVDRLVLEINVLLDEYSKRK
jgi:protein SCO1/2